MKQKLKSSRRTLENSTQRRVFLQPKRELQDLSQKVDELEGRLINTMRSYIDLVQEKTQSKIGKLDTLSPLKILGRGYSYCRKEGETQELTSIKEVNSGDDLEIFLSNGKIISQVKETIKQEIKES
jgi:exodeoxyribonuclease VII large subunit